MVTLRAMEKVHDALKKAEDNRRDVLFCTLCVGGLTLMMGEVPIMLDPGGLCD